MRTKQDGVPTAHLPRVMAVDAHGRVLRRPYFLTKEEHDSEVARIGRIWADVMATERRKKEALAGAIQDLIAENEALHAERGALTTDELKLRPRILSRTRFHWLLRWLIKVG